MKNVFIRNKEIIFKIYLILKIVKDNSNHTIYWLHIQMYKNGFSTHERVLRNIIRNMAKDKLVLCIEGDKPNSRFISLTKKGERELNRLTLKMKLLLNKIKQ